MKLPLPVCIAIACAMALTTSCAPPAAATPAQAQAVTPSPTPAPPSPTPSATPTATPTETPSPTPVPTVESLTAIVTVDGFLSCRYGPGPNYLYLYALNKDANIKLIGRANETNWHWVYVDGKNKCWVNTEYIDIHGDWTALPIVYPGIAKLPVSPDYPPTTVLKVMRQKNQVTVQWADIPLRAGDEEDQYMQHYVVEVWHCVGGQMLFEPLATNDLTVTFVDEPGCSEPSHGRVFVQEKHGFSGPTEIPWPQYQ